MSIREVAATIRSGLELLSRGRAVLHATAVAFAEARDTVQQATRGTTRAEAATAIAALTAALDQIAEVTAQIDAATATTTDYLNHIAGAGDTPIAAPTPDRVEQLRAELPPPLLRKGTGRKTHGRWFADGVPPQVLISGEDKTSALATYYLDRIGEERAAIRSHVEVKLAALIRRRFDQTGQAVNAIVVVNQEVCEGRSSCFTLLPRLLPPGCSITVYTPTTRHTFTGGQ